MDAPNNREHSTDNPVGIKVPGLVLSLVENYYTRWQPMLSSLETAHRVLHYTRSIWKQLMHQDDPVVEIVALCHDIRQPSQQQLLRAALRATFSPRDVNTILFVCHCVALESDLIARDAPHPTWWLEQRVAVIQSAKRLAQLGPHGFQLRMCWVEAEYPEWSSQKRQEWMRVYYQTTLQVLAKKMPQVASVRVKNDLRLFLAAVDRYPAALPKEPPVDVKICPKYKKQWQKAQVGKGVDDLFAH